MGDSRKWWLLPIALLIFLFNIVWVNVFRRQPVGK